MKWAGETTTAGPDVAQHPWVLYVALVVMILIVIAQGIPKILGPIGQMLHEWAARKRTTSAEADAEKTAELEQELAYAKGVAAERLRELKARDALMAEHTIWDWEQFRRAVERGEQDVRMPPPLVPDPPPVQTID